jgi:hypothetical protein
LFKRIKININTNIINTKLNNVELNKTLNDRLINSNIRRSKLIIKIIRQAYSN